MQKNKTKSPMQPVRIYIEEPDRNFSGSIETVSVAFLELVPVFISSSGVIPVDAFKFLYNNPFQFLCVLTVETYVFGFAEKQQHKTQ